MTNNCNPIDCPAYASDWCEYDFATDQTIPVDPNCPLLKEDEH